MKKPCAQVDPTKPGLEGQVATRPGPNLRPARCRKTLRSCAYSLRPRLTPPGWTRVSRLLVFLVVRGPHRLGNERLDITANTGQGGVDFTSTGDTTNRRFGYNDYPDVVSAENTQAGTGGAGQDQELAMAFFCRNNPGACPSETS